MVAPLQLKGHANVLKEVPVPYRSESFNVKAKANYDGIMAALLKSGCTWEYSAMNK